MKCGVAAEFCREKTLKQRMKEDQRICKRLHTLGHFPIGRVEKPKLFQINPCHVTPVNIHQNKEKMQKGEKLSVLKVAFDFLIYKVIISKIQRKTCVFGFAHEKALVFKTSV